MSTASDIREAIECLEQYGNVDFAAEHDQFYVGIPGVLDDEILNEDIEYLEERLFFLDEDDYGWFYRFV